MPIKVAIVEDHIETLNSLSALLNRTETILVVGGFTSGESALKEIPYVRPEVVLLDLGLPEISGIEVIRGLADSLPDLEIIVLTVEEDKNNLFAALKAGASGYLLKDSTPSEIIEAIEEVYNHGSPMSPKVARYVVDYFNGIWVHDREKDRSLTERECEILNGIADGLTDKRLADRLFISPHTVRTHLKNIYDKLHVHSKVEAVMKAKKEGVL